MLEGEILDSVWDRCHRIEFWYLLICCDNSDLQNKELSELKCWSHAIPELEKWCFTSLWGQLNVRPVVDWQVLVLNELFYSVVVLIINIIIKNISYKWSGKFKNFETPISQCTMNNILNMLFIADFAGLLVKNSYES
jgi:hypothetical protein